MSEHTPGPWEVSENEKGGIRVLSRAYCDEEPVICGGVKHWPLILEDAKLIAASPALLAACKAAVEWRGLDGDGISDPVLSQLRAAIKEATP